MSKRYYHKVINPQMGGLQQHLQTDTNYELIKIVPYTMYETVLVFVEHVDDPVSDLVVKSPEATDE